MTVAIPGNWHPRLAVPARGAVVLLDLDGVIADAGHRQRFLHQDEPDWDGFYAGVADDGVLEAGRALAASIASEVPVVVLTGRIDEVADVTQRWLDEHGIRWDMLICRPAHEDDDSRHAVDYKRDEIAQLRAFGYELRLAADDNRKIVAMFEEAGIPALYVPSGYYENSNRYDGGV
ncbi:MULTISPECIES: hypothetical protein [unclassified Microbacterium]|uniref:phosphatase domain-containing protein n=1 Tax=unclassified Microbacterium TaxID=2609290 RepID=UPI001D78B0D2|nr:MULTISPECIES: hypothetical protein [unclassified Microbacterium]CAH0155070.1 hypothetical protein SRABI121_01358 [Microbacterium sp. Bi121]HWK78586.1 hypothetical protein [Microbacterium sp.]